MKNLMQFSSVIIVVCFLGSSSDASIRGIGGPRKSPNDAPIISTTSGQLRGLHVVKSKRVEAFQYLGVPYAEPPVGELRFQRPQPLNRSNISLRDATELAPTCVQIRHLPQFISPLLNVDEEHKTSEDCLYLNIYVPKQAMNGKQNSLPIMVWLPGEGYDFADARQYDGSYLASMGNVIVITVQYRVGVFGFLKSDSINGNMGLWDQIMALKWIRKNARAIGGDADNITVFGRFTGSMSISILLTSPVTRDMKPSLFKRAILLSGVAVGKWVFENNAQKKANQLFADIGCKDQSKDCLNTIPAQTILEKSGYLWRPTIDSELITEEPLKAMENGKMANGVTEVMLGTNKVEGNLCLLTHFATKSKFYEKILNNELTEKDYIEMIGNDMRMFFNNNSEDMDSYQQKVFISSLIDRNQNTSLREKYLEFCSSLFITSHMKNFNKLIINRQLSKQKDANTTLTNTFMYELNYRPSFSIAPQFIESAVHGDDVLLAFGLIHASGIKFSKNDEKITEMLIKSFSNFATYGNPKGLNQISDNLWSNQEISVIKLNVESETTKEKDVVAVTQLFLFSSTAEVLIAFLTTSTTILALLATSLICFIIFSLQRQRYSMEHMKDSPLL